MPASSCSNDQLIDRADALHAQVCRTQVDLLEVLAELDDRGSVWEDWGAQDMAHWVSMRYGVSYYRAERWIGAGHALKELPLVSEAFASGELSLDKVVELTRFATPETEQVLVAWARGVSAGRIRHQAELLRKAERDEAAQADRDRSVSWYFYDQGRRFAMSTDLPAAEGTRLVRALDRRARSLPIMPGEHGPWGIEARRADALVAMASEHLAADPDPDRATVIVHARVGGGESANGGPIAGPLHAAELEAGPVLHPRWRSACCVTPGSRWWWRTPPASPSAWGGCAESPRSGCSAS